MNWQTNRPFNTKPTDPAWEMCEHVENDSAKPHQLCCEECYKQNEETAGLTEEYCHDCGQSKPMKEMIKWTWYDFDYKQGDEPLLICNECKVKR